MPENVKVSALTESTDEQMRDGALMLNSVIDGGSSTGFSSKKTTFSRFANYLLNKFAGLSLAGENQTVKDAVDGIKEEKADKSGTYDNMMVGTAKQLLSESYTLDRTPYKFRKSPYTDRLSESIVGCSVAWNQLVQNGNFVDTGGWYLRGVSMNVSNNVATVANTGGDGDQYASQNIPLLIGHKYLLTFDGQTDSVSTSNAQSLALMYFGTASDYKEFKATTANTWFACASIFRCEANNYNVIRLRCPVSNTSHKYKNVKIHDLTAMFGSSVADALYNMGDDGIKLFRSRYPSTYYPYSEPTMEHVSGLEAHEMVGFNTFDIGASVLGESVAASTGAITTRANAWRSDYIKCLPNTEYYASGLASGNSNFIAFYDADKTFISRTGGIAVTERAETTPSRCAYLIITQYASGSETFVDARKTVCVNLSNSAKNGTYKPYESHSYALDASLTLRGLIKYDSVKGFYADGDVYASDGTVTRKWGSYTITSVLSVGEASSGIKYARVAALSDAKSGGYIFAAGYQNSNDATVDRSIRFSGTNIYVYDNRFTDAATALSMLNGLEAVYELATPTTESAEPYDAIQITDGTEEYITDCLAPVGHESKYYENLRSKIEGLPTDFSAIICATEPTSKASKNYAVGDYLIYGNTLYKVTRAIATNAALTVGTNISATTIMAEIKALQ